MSETEQGSEASAETHLDDSRLTTTAIVLALTCAAIWAGQSVAVKVAVEEVPPLLLMTSRFLLAMPLLLLFAWMSRLRVAAARSELRALLWSALLLIVQIGLYTIGTKLTSSVHSIILINTFPFFVALMGPIWIPTSKVTPKTLVGLGIAFVGVIAIVGDRLNAESYSITGDVLVLAAATVMGAKIVYMKRVMRSVHPTKLVLWDNFGAAALLLVCGPLLEDWSGTAPSSAALVAILYQGLVVSAIAFLLWVHLISRYSPHQLNVFRLATPPLGALLGALILAEPFTLSILIALSCVYLGAYCVLN